MKRQSEPLASRDCRHSKASVCATRDRYRKLHKEYCILIIEPMKNEEQHLIKIEISFEWMKYAKRKLWHLVSDWSIVYFRYNCSTQAFVVDEVKLGGI